MCSGWYGRKQGYAISISQHQWIVAIQRSSKCIQLLEWHISATVSRILPLAKWSLCVALQKYFFSFLLHFPFICCLSVIASIISHSLLVSLCAQAFLSLALLCPSYLHRVFLLDLFPKQEDSSLLSVCNCSCNCLYRQKTDIPSMDPYH